MKLRRCLSIAFLVGCGGDGSHALPDGAGSSIDAPGTTADAASNPNGPQLVVLCQIGTMPNAEIVSRDPTTGVLGTATPFSTGGGTPIGGGGTSRHALVANSTTDSVTVVDTTTTPPTVGTTISLATGAAPQTVVMHPNGKFAYVIDKGTSSTHGDVVALAFSDTAGTATMIGTAHPTGVLSSDAVIDPTGTFLYVADSGMTTGDLAIFRIGGDGALTPLPGSPFAVGQRPYRLAIHPTLPILYISDLGLGRIGKYAIATDGTVTSTDAGTPVGSFPGPLAVDPHGKYLFVLTQSLHRLTIDSAGVLTSDPNAYSTGQGPVGLAITGDGKFVYVADNFDKKVFAFSVAADGTPTALPTLTTSIFNPAAVIIQN